MGQLRSGPRPIAVIVAALIASCAMATPVPATTWTAPMRPLSDAERMEMAVTAANAVIIASIVSTGVASPDDTNPAIAGKEWMEVIPERSIKGTIEQPAALRVYFPDISDFGRSKVRRWARTKQLPMRALMFLHSVSTQNGFVWALREHPDHPGNGLVPLNADGTVSGDSATIASTTIVERAESVADQSSLENIAMRSPVIALGTAIPGAGRGQYGGYSFKCTGLLVQEVIAGAISAGATISVYGPYGGLGIKGPVLLMLSPDNSGAYEIVGSTGGIQLIRDTSVIGSGENVRKLLSRLRQIKSRQIEAQKP